MNNSLISSGTVYSTNGPVIYLSGGISGKEVSRRSVIAATIIIIFYISVNRLKRRSAVTGLLRVGAGNSNGLADNNIFRNLLLYSNFTVNGGNIAYISNYILISSGIGILEYWV